MLAVDPQQFAGGGIHCDDRTPRPGRRVENAVHHQRRPFEFVFRAVAEIVGLDAPRDFEVVEVGGVDLVERPVARAREIGGVRRPLRVFGVVLRGCTERHQNEHSDDA